MKIGGRHFGSAMLLMAGTLFGCARGDDSGAPPPSFPAELVSSLRRMAAGTASEDEQRSVVETCAATYIDYQRVTGSQTRPDHRTWKSVSAAFLPPDPESKRNPVVWLWPIKGSTSKYNPEDALTLTALLQVAEEAAPYKDAQGGPVKIPVGFYCIFLQKTKGLDTVTGSLVPRYVDGFSLDLVGRFDKRTPQPKYEATKWHPAKDFPRLPDEPLDVREFGGSNACFSCSSGGWCEI